LPAANQWHGIVIMNEFLRATRPDLYTLLGLFPQADDVPEHEFVPADEVPPPYQQLLVHEHHMTVTVEEHHGGPVDVHILNRRHDDNYYARRILLQMHDGGRVVQFGIVRLDLRFCTKEVRQEILGGNTPLGRILIKHNVLRRIEPTAYLRVIPGFELTEAFQLPAPRPTYGRLAIIHCDGKPAIELLEVVAPE
jgi:chorismate-pyruvate lyase